MPQLQLRQVRVKCDASMPKLQLYSTLSNDDTPRMTNGGDVLCYMLQQAPALRPHNRPGPCRIRLAHLLVGEVDGGSPARAAPQSIPSISGFQRFTGLLTTRVRVRAHLRHVTR